jgi:hypothetical protein
VRKRKVDVLEKPDLGVKPRSLMWVIGTNTERNLVFDRKRKSEQPRARRGNQGRSLFGDFDYNSMALS